MGYSLYSIKCQKNGKSGALKLYITLILFFCVTFSFSRADISPYSLVGVFGADWWRAEWCWLPRKICMKKTNKQTNKKAEQWSKCAQQCTFTFQGGTPGHNDQEEGNEAIAAVVNISEVSHGYYTQYVTSKNTLQKIKMLLNNAKKLLAGKDFYWNILLTSLLSFSGWRFMFLVGVLGADELAWAGVLISGKG